MARITLTRCSKHFACAARSARHGGRCSRGFTFAELIIVIVILGIIFAFAAPKLDGLTPRYRLRTAARRLATQLESHRVTAISRGVWVGVRYHLNGENSTWELIKPPPPEFPNMPIEERSSFGIEELPEGVSIDSIEIRGSNDVYTSGSVLILFSPVGTHGSHSVTFRNDRDAILRVKLNAFTGVVDFDNGVGASFDDFAD